MIQKIVKVQNVGKLVDCVCRGSVDFRRLTLMFARNGLGKTTLCDILRSYQGGDASYIHGRKTLGIPAAPEVVLRVSNSTVTFGNGEWSSNDPMIQVFGTEFIEDNVYSGTAVTHEHKKNLYRVIVGEEGVRLAREVDRLDEELRKATRQVTDGNNAVQKMTPRGWEASKFLALQEEDDLEGKLKVKRKELQTVERSREIAERPVLAPITLPSMPPTLREALGKTLEDISGDVEAAVRQHIRTCTEAAPEEWVADGLAYVKDKACPFCGQSLEGQDLIDSYRGYFSEAYQSLAKEIEKMEESLWETLGEATIQRLTRVVENNGRLSDFWSQFMRLNLPIITEAQIQDGITALRESLMEKVFQKKQALLRGMTVDTTYPETVGSHKALSELVSRYNSTVETVNRLIEAQKLEAGRGDPEGRKAELLELEAKQARYSEEGRATAQVYDTALSSRATLEGQKQEAKRALDGYSDNILREWKGSLNRLLTNFGAGFTIAEVRRQYVGGSVSSTFRIMINGVPIDPGDQTTPRDQPSFRNTLSDGDRAALALAFFLAMIERDPQIADKIVVFDDPFSSLDSFRRAYTQQCISRMARRAKQVIVLSHDPSFLRMIEENGDPRDTRTIKLSFLGNKTEIVECDLASETLPGYEADIRKLQAFLDDRTGELRAVARAIRPVLEGCLRHRFPGEFGDNGEVGNMIARIRDANPGDVLDSAKGILDDLEDINAYSRRYHHAGWRTEPVDDSELATYARRIVDLARGA